MNSDTIAKLEEAFKLASKYAVEDTYYTPSGVF